MPLKVNCFILRSKYLGPMVFKDGGKIDPKKVTAKVNWPPPVTVTNVRRFL